mmetsp:Transcript_1475/g.4799  ORF Transcript_1475/g.4799 Transcript_1475/m.4799 type:complete len:578 (+) Transcript_1475:258-1991(+)
MGTVVGEVLGSSQGRPAVPVTLLSGFLGAGKTTLLKSILEQTHATDPADAEKEKADGRKYKVAVLVNDMAEVNIDANLVRDSKLLETEEKLVELHNGCICCTLREDLVKALADLVYDEENAFDAIIVESTGVSLPREVADTFLANVTPTATIQEKQEKQGKQQQQEDKKATETVANPATESMEAIMKALRGKISLNEIARLDTCVTMVDVAAFQANMATNAEMQEQFKGSVDEGDKRSVGPLLTEQIEFADVVVLSKCDLVPEEEASAVEDAVRALNPKAKITRAFKGQIPLSSVLCTGLFSMEKAASAAGWMQLIDGAEDDVPETELYGIHSFVYKARTPFHPARLAFFLNDHFFVRIEEQAMEVKVDEKDFQVRQQVRSARMKKKFGHILRSKGCMWLAGRDHLIGGWSQAGGVGDFSCLGFWTGFLPKHKWPPEGSKELERVLSFFQGPLIQDRRQELVFIGQNLNQEAIRQALDACLITKEDLKKRKDERKTYQDRKKVSSYLNQQGTKQVDAIVQALDKLDPDAEKAKMQVEAPPDYFTEHFWKLGVNYLNDPFPSWPPAELFKIAGFPGKQ